MTCRYLRCIALIYSSVAAFHNVIHGTKIEKTNDSKSRSKQTSSKPKIWVKEKNSKTRGCSHHSEQDHNAFKNPSTKCKQQAEHTSHREQTQTSQNPVKNKSPQASQTTGPPHSKQRTRSGLKAPKSMLSQANLYRAHKKAPTCTSTKKAQSEHSIADIMASESGRWPEDPHAALVTGNISSLFPMQSSIQRSSKTTQFCPDKTAPYTNETAAQDNMNSASAKNRSIHTKQVNNLVQKQRSNFVQGTHCLCKGDSRQLSGGGKQNTRTTKGSMPNISYKPFSATGSDWLKTDDIVRCLQLLLYIKYPHAGHQPPMGPAHEVHTQENLELQFLAATHTLTSSGDRTNFPNTLHASLKPDGPCPSIVFGDHVHWRVICINSRDKTVYFIDPFGSGFPQPTQTLVQNFYNQDAENKCTFKTWNHRMQQDTYNCGIWAIWFMEQWMQYWCERQADVSFESLCIENAQGKSGTLLRQHYHDIILQGHSQKDEGTSLIEIARNRQAQRFEIQDTMDVTGDEADMQLLSHGTASPTLRRAPKPWKTTKPIDRPEVTKHTFKPRRRKDSTKTSNKTDSLNASSETLQQHMTDRQHKAFLNTDTGKRDEANPETEHNSAATTNPSQHQIEAKNDTDNEEGIDYFPTYETDSETADEEDPIQTTAQPKATGHQEMKHHKQEELKISNKRQRTPQTCGKTENAHQTVNANDKKQKVSGDFEDAHDDLTVMTWNVMGTTTVLHEIQAYAEKYQPWVIVLTETKLTELEQDRKSLNPYLPQYKLYHSRIKGQATKHYRTGSGGVAIAVHESLTTQNSVRLLNIDDPAAKSHCKAIEISPPGSATIVIWGLYVPCNDQHKRQQLYALIKENMTAIDREAMKSNRQPPYHVVAGDMNAALYPDDKQGKENDNDFMHRQLIHDLQLHTTDTRHQQPRTRTFRSKHSAEQDSRIDDIFTSVSLQNPNTKTAVLNTTGDSDHDPILSKIPLTCKGFHKPGPDPMPLPRKPKLKTPVAAEHLRKFKADFELGMASEIAALTKEINTALAAAQRHANTERHSTKPRKFEARDTGMHTDSNQADYTERIHNSLKLNESLKTSLAEEGINADYIERLDKSLQKILQHIVPMSMQIMPYTKGGEAINRQRNRVTHRELKNLRKTRAVLYDIVKLYRDSQPKKITSKQSKTDNSATTDNPHISAEPKYDLLSHQVLQLLQTIPAQQKHNLPVLTPPNQPNKQEWQDWEACLMVQRRIVQDQKDKIVQGLKRQQINAQKRHAQKTYVRNPKRMHKKILKPSENNIRLLHMRHSGTGKMLKTPEDITEYVHTTFQKQARPAFGESKQIPTTRCEKRISLDKQNRTRPILSRNKSRYTSVWYLLLARACARP